MKIEQISIPVLYFGVIAALLKEGGRQVLPGHVKYIW
jgi:hypothetical protein